MIRLQIRDTARSEFWSLSQSSEHGYRPYHCAGVCKSDFDDRVICKMAFFPLVSPRKATSLCSLDLILIMLTTALYIITRRIFSIHTATESLHSLSLTLTIPQGTRHKVRLPPSSIPREFYIVESVECSPQVLPIPFTLQPQNSGMEMGRQS